MCILHRGIEMTVDVSDGWYSSIKVNCSILCCQNGRFRLCTICTANYQMHRAQRFYNEISESQLQMWAWVLLRPVPECSTGNMNVVSVVSLEGHSPRFTALTGRATMSLLIENTAHACWISEKYSRILLLLSACVDLTNKNSHRCPVSCTNAH